MYLDKCVEESLAKLSPMSFKNQDGDIFHVNLTVDENECEIYVWPQIWSDTSCGFGGLAGQMITNASTVVVVGPQLDACVYHGGRFAYKIEQVGENFWKAIDNRELPAKREGKERRKLQKEPENVAEHAI